MDTNYRDTFITVSPDTTATRGGESPKPGSIAEIQLRLLRAAPYRLTSDELLFAVHVERAGIADEDRAAAWEAFSARSHACLRASPLVKQYGWGLHHDADCRVAAFGVETDAYRDFQSRDDLKVVPGIRSSRA